MSFRSSRCSRRHVLRGAGIALALPWLESLEPRAARAQAVQAPLRFLPIFLPNGAPEAWKPERVGVGTGWALSPLLSPFAQLKERLSVISGLENGSVFNADGSATVEPAHGRQSGAWLTCQDARAVRQRLNVPDANGVSVDQLLAATPGFSSATMLPSLQVGLSTLQSDCGSEPCSLSRTLSWKSETEPLAPHVDPQQVFELIVGAAQAGRQTPEASRRRAEDQSVLDSVQEGLAVLGPRLSQRDRDTLDRYLTSVRDVEQRIVSNEIPGCTDRAPRPFVDLKSGAQFASNQAPYDREQHAQLMNELVVLALSCDATRVISYLLDDENSHFIYDHAPRITLTQTGATAAGGRCGEYAAAHEAASEDYTSISYWLVRQVSQLCQSLALVPDVGGTSLLDNTVVFFGAGTHGSNHACADLPAILIGGGGGRLRLDQHVQLAQRPLRDLYFTLQNGVFELGVSDFGVNLTGAPLALIDELLR